MELKEVLIMPLPHKPMKETQMHRDVFEVYFLLKPDRSLERCRQALIKAAVTDNSLPTPALRTLNRWSVEFDWQERIMLREKEIAKGVESKLIKNEINSRAASIKSIRHTLDALKKTLASAFYKRAKDGQIALREAVEIQSSKDLVSVATAIIKGEAEIQNIIEPELKIEGDFKLKYEEVPPEIAKKVGKELASKEE